jgi:small-conductance mechanosensitive channel
MQDFGQILGELGEAARVIGGQVASLWVLAQLALILLAAVAAATLAALVRRRVDLVALTMGWPAFLRLFVRAIVANAGMIAFLAIAAPMHAALLALAPQAGGYLLEVAEKLAAAWIVIHVLAGLIRNRIVYRLLAVSAWTVAALSILGLLGPIAQALDSVAVEIGGLRVSPLLVLKTILLLILATWAASALSNFLDRRVQGAPDLTPSLRVLIGKLVRLTLMTLAILIVVRSTGIDLSALAIFTGALGVGLGFGLQKIVSNFVSGVILLADKSIKPGDVITVGDSYGWVNAMNTRCVAVITRDGREVLIPNEDLVTQRVVNWSYTKQEVRLDVPFGVDVASDPHRVRRAAVEAAACVPRVLTHPAPVCHFVAFGSKSLDFMLRFWIADPVAGVTNVRGLVLLALWDAFRREGIEIPSPIQDVRLTDPAGAAAREADPSIVPREAPARGPR